MKWSTAAGLVVCFGVLGLVARRVTAQPPLTPRETLDNVEARLDEANFAPRELLGILERTLRDSRTRESEELTRATLQMRARLYQRLGAFADAREDLERISTLYGGTDAPLRLQIIELLSDEGHVAEAWQRTIHLLAADPSLHKAWRMRADLERLQANEAADRARNALSKVLVSVERDEALAILEQVLARRPGDPDRARLAGELRAVFARVREDAAVANILDHADRSSDLLADARHAYASTIQLSGDLEAIDILQQMLADAGRPDLAAGIGMAARTLPGATEDYRLTHTLINSLVELGQVDRAMRIMSEIDWRKPEVDLAFVQAAGRIMHEAESWGQLNGVSAGLRQKGGANDRAAASFYQGEGYFYRRSRDEAQRESNWNQAIRAYETFLDKEVIEPVPGAVARAYMALSKIYGSLGNDTKEYSNLVGALQLEPRLDGDLWLRRAVLRRKGTNDTYRAMERDWTEGMALLPARVEDLSSAWDQMGDKSLESEQITFDHIWRRTVQMGRANPPRDVGPNVRFRVARRHLEAGNAVSALTVARGLYEEYPGLLPALDVMIEAQLAKPARVQASHLLLERLKLVGPDAQFRAYMALLGTDIYPQDKYLEVLRLDPKGEGRTAVALYMLSSGQPERALRALRHEPEVAPEPEPGQEPIEIVPIPEHDILRSIAFLQLDEHKRASDAAARAIGYAHLEEQAFELIIKSSLSRPLDLARVVKAYAARESLHRDIALRMADHLLAGNALKECIQILTRLDDDPATRGGDVLIRMALASALAEDRDRLEESLERAEAFYDDGRVELARLLSSVQRRDWFSLPHRVAELRSTRFRPTPLQEAILRLFEERVDHARDLTDQGLQRAGNQDPGWALLDAALREITGDPLRMPPAFGPTAARETHAFLRGLDGQPPRDPRQALGLLLALDVEGWSLFAIPRLAQIHNDRGCSLWTMWLGSLAMDRVGRTEPASKVRTALTTKHPKFQPGWTRHIDDVLQASEGDVLHPEVLLARGLRMQALGATPDSSILDLVALDLIEDRRPDALERLKTAEPQDMSDAASFLLARMDAEDGFWRSASSRYFNMLIRGEPDPNDPRVDEYAWILRDGMSATRGQIIRPGQVLGEVRKLADHSPQDPYLALLALEVSNLDSQSRQTMSIARAEGALEVMRERTNNRPLDDIRPGSALEWSQTLRRLSPRLAESLLVKELEGRAGHLDLWVERASALDEMGRQREALAVLSSVLTASDDAEGHMTLADLLSRRGATLEQVTGHLASAIDQLGDVVMPRARLIRGRASLQNPGRKFSATIQDLRELWQERRDLERPLPELQLATTYAQALFERSSEVDRTYLAIVLPHLRTAGEDEAYIEDAALAFSGILEHGVPRLADGSPAPRGSDADEDSADGTTSGARAPGDEDADGSTSDDADPDNATAGDDAPPEDASNEESDDTSDLDDTEDAEPAAPAPAGSGV